MIILGVNIDHVATLRQARESDYPSVTEAAIEAIKGGARQITIHLREDRRHIQDKDLYNIKKIISVPLNLEMGASSEIVKIALDAVPEIVTLVPEKRQELTTEGGLDCISNEEKLKAVINNFKKSGIQVSLFIDPEIKQIEKAKELGAGQVELHTGRYCEVFGEPAEKKCLSELKEAARRSKNLGLKVCAGHGLNYENVSAVVNNIPEIEEFNIGHSIISRAVFTGLREAVKEMNNLINKE